ncbi:MAG: hypothetical protein NTY71_05425 [Methanoregula sp.]|nr:hypothetical protein [Methanoregula sp.]
MVRRCFPVLLFILVIFLILPPACGHVPLSAGENDNPASATVINQPEKSYVIYGHIHEPDGVAYYRFDMTTGQTLHVSLMVNGKDAAIPDLVIMGAGIPVSGTPPASLRIPQGSAVFVIPGRLPEHAEYEPFTPSAIYQVASYTALVPASGTYYVAVHTSRGEQDYSLAPGFKEEFSATEWLLVPVNVIGIHTWEGQSPVIVLAPCIAVVLLGIALLLRQQRRTGVSRSPFSWLAITAGLLYLGGASITFTQMVRALGITGWDPSAILTLIFISIPVVLGIVALRTGFGSGQPVLAKERVVLAVIGLLGLLFWAGLIIGPVIAFVAAVVPEKPKRKD